MLGLFDSGVGGLTILKEIQKILPEKKIIYFADNQNCPLGEKSSEEIYKITIEAVKFLFDKGCNLVILACNTATSVAIRRIQGEWLVKNYPDKKVLGIIRPVPESLIENQRIRNNLVAIMATPATIKQGFYEQELRDFGFENILSISCTGLAIAIENNLKSKVDLLLDECLGGFLNQIPLIDDLVLACTHYPLIKNEIQKKLTKFGAKPSLHIFDQGKIVAEKLSNYLSRHPGLKIIEGKVEILTSRDQAEFILNAKRILG